MAAAEAVAVLAVAVVAHAEGVEEAAAAVVELRVAAVAA